MIDIAGLNGLVLWKHKNPDWNPNKRFKRRLFIAELGMGLVSPLLDFRSTTSKTLHKDIRNALAVFGYPLIEEESQELDENSIQTKRKRCSICHFSKDKKASTQCSRCSEFVCKEHSVKQIFCTTCAK